MPAKLSAFPSYVLFDASTYQTITPSGKNFAPNCVTGTTNNIIDKNVATYYQVSCAGTNPVDSEITIDYRRTFFCCIVQFNAYMDNAATFTAEISLNGTDWTTIKTSNATGAHNYIDLIDSLRYIRFSATGGNSSALVRVYECHLFGE